ncbi:hypothetical protein I4U23_027319 [Adineta vaga]|nr:hypothetical protein I4U23_027319 [Adineta vaga]
MIELNLTSPRDFQLADYAFGRSDYFTLVIQDIQYSYIYKLPYKFNLKALYNTTIYELTIRNSGEIDFIPTESSTINIYRLLLADCSIKNVTPLMEALSISLQYINFYSINLTELPSMTKFKQLSKIYLRNNSIEEIKLNTLSHMPRFTTLDLSNNRIKQIAPDTFIGSNLITLYLDSNFLTSISFLYPLSQSLSFLTLSNNFIEDLNPLKEMFELIILDICCNKINKIDEFNFNKLFRLTSVDLSYNEIEFIHPMAFNGTTISSLKLDGNLLSSLEVNLTETTSFLYSIASTILSLSFVNCTKFFYINWYVLTKLQTLRQLDLSGINKTDQFWSYRVIDNDTMINWFHRPYIILNDIQFTDHDYCLSTSITHILNQTVLFVDDNHQCNCFIYKYKHLFVKEQRPLCMSNEMIMAKLSTRCADIDLLCDGSLISKSNQQWRIILAAVIPSVFILIIVLFLLGVYINKRKKRRVVIETSENVDN